MYYFFNFPYRLDYNFKNNRTVQNEISTRQFTTVPIFGYYFDRLLILIVLVFYLSLVDIEEGLKKLYMITLLLVLMHGESYRP